MLLMRALLLALDNIYHAIDEGSSTVLISLDLSAAFDTIDHTILLSLLQTSFGISRLALVHGSTPILRRTVNLSVLAVPRLQLLCAPQAFRKDLSLVLCFFPYSSHPLNILSVHMASCSSSTLTTLSSVAICKDDYDTPDAKLDLYLLTIHTWFC